jgi:hypothetical protein
MSKYQGNSRVVAGLASKHFPKVIKPQTIMIAATSLGIFYKMFGLYGGSKLPVERDREGYYNIKAEHFKVTEGYDYEIHVAAEYPALGTIQNGVEEVQLVKPNFDPNLFAAFKQTQTHFHQDIFIPKSEVNKAKNRLTQEAVVDRYAKVYARGGAETIHRMLWQNTDQSGVALAGLPFIVSETNNTYLLDRSQEKNAYWRPQRIAASGAFNDLDPLAVIQSRIMAAGGRGDLMVADTELFAWSRRRLEETGNLATYKGKVEFGGDLLMYGNSVICQDPLVDLDSNGNRKLYCLSTEHFYAYSTDTEEASSFNVAPYANNALHGKVDFYLGLGCEKCNAQGLIYGITAPT